MTTLPFRQCCTSGEEVSGRSRPDGSYFFGDLQELPGAFPAKVPDSASRWAKTYIGLALLRIACGALTNTKRRLQETILVALVALVAIESSAQ